MSSVVIDIRDEGDNLFDFYDSIEYTKLLSILKFLQSTYGDLFQLNLGTKCISLLSECMDMYITFLLPILPNSNQADGIFEFNCSTLLDLIEQKLQSSSNLVVFKIENIQNRLFLCVANWPSNTIEIKVLLRPGNAMKILDIDAKSKDSEQYIGPVSCRDIMEWMSYGFLPSSTFVELKITGKHEITTVAHQDDIGFFIVKKRKTFISNKDTDIIYQSSHFQSLLCKNGFHLVSFDAKKIKSFLELFPNDNCLLSCASEEPLHLCIDRLKMIVIPHNCNE
jgi:hypothetical protein